MRPLGFAVLAIAAAVVAACSGGSPHYVPGADGPAHKKAARAEIILRIPPHRRHRRRPNYISPGTVSLAFAVQPIGSSNPSPTPMPLQTFNVATPSPCSTIASSGGELQCQFTVQVMPGRDVIGIATYPTPNAQGSPLSGYVSGVETIPTPGANGQVTPLSFTLEGVVSTVKMSYSSPSSAAQPNVEVLPIGATAPASALSVIPYDAANYEILEPAPAPGATYTPFLNTLTLKVTPDDGNVTLSNASGSGTTLTIAGPSGLQNLNVNYGGSFASSGGAPVDQYSITATLGSVSLPSRRIENVRMRPNPVIPTPTPSAPPSEAIVDLSSNAIDYPLNLVAPLPSPSPEGMVADSAGNLYFYYDYTSGTTPLGMLVKFDSSTQTQVATQGMGFSASDITYDSANNALWLADCCDGVNPGAVACYNASLVQGASSPFVQSGTVNVIADANGTLYYQVGGASGSVVEQPITGLCMLSPGSTFADPITNVPGAMVSSGASTAVIGFASSGSFSGSVYGVTPSGFSLATPLPAYNPSGIYQVNALRQAGTNIYVGVSPYTCYTTCSAYLGVISGGTMSLASVLPAPGADPYVIAYNSGTTIAYTDGANGALGIYDPATSSNTEMPLSTCSVSSGTSSIATKSSISGASYDSDGTIWVNCVSVPVGASSPQPNLVRVVPTHAWSLFANPNAMLCGSAAFIGIAGAQPSDSFTVTGTGVLSGAALSGDEILVTPSCSVQSSGTIAVTETHSGRSQTLSFTVYPTGPPPMRRHHRGYPALHRN